MLLFCRDKVLSQIPGKNLSVNQKKYFQVLKETAEYLKTKPTTPLSFHETENYTKEEAFTTRLLIGFFQKIRCKRHFQRIHHSLE